MKNTATKTGLAKRRVQFIADNYANQIRFLDTDTAIGLLLIELPLIAKEYGARENIDETLNECVEFVMEKFKTLSVQEVREAYRQYSAGDFDLKGAEMYGGVFTVAQLGKVLTAYRKNRNSIFAELEKQREKEERDARLAILEKQRQEQFDKDFPNMIARAKTEITDWRKVPEYWYDAAMKREMIQFKEGEKAAIWEESQDLAKVEAKQRKEDAQLGGMQFENIDPFLIAQKFARKITVYRKVLGETN